MGGWRRRIRWSRRGHGVVGEGSLVLTPDTAGLDAQATGLDMELHNLRLGDTPVEPFRHFVNELGIERLRLDTVLPQPGGAHSLF